MINKRVHESGHAGMIRENTGKVREKVLVGVCWDKERQHSKGQVHSSGPKRSSPGEFPSLVEQTRNFLGKEIFPYLICPILTL